MESMDVMRAYMTENYLPLESFNSLYIIYWTAHQQRSKVNNKEPSIYYLKKNKVGSSI